MDRETDAAGSCATRPAVALFDLDGVIRHWSMNEIAELERRHRLERGTLFAVAFDPSLLVPAITGRFSDEEWRGKVSDRLTELHGVDGPSVVADWTASRATVDSAVLSLVGRARQRCRVGLLTNATTRLDLDLSLLNLADCFDQVFSSAALGVAKPDPSCFNAVLTGLGVAPEAAIFVDDSEVNVRSASALGIRSHVFVEARGLDLFLQGVGL